MRINASILSFLIVFFIATTTAVLPAEARSTTGFASFRVANEGSYPTDPYNCLMEDNGAVVNDCSFPVNLTFEVPVDKDGTCNFCVDVFLSGYINFPMTVQSYWGSHASFSCAENYLSPSWDVGYLSTDSGTFFLNTYPTTTGFSINLIDDASGGALELDCTNIPPGAGIANINWNLGVQSSATP
jgi:hypothetical protein